MSVLALSFFYPGGLINYEKFESDSILIAQREGAANCMTTFKLKENNKFSERSVCFGVSQITGDYELINDTIFFSNVVLPRHEKEYYKYAIIQPSRLKIINNNYDLVRYSNENDTTGHTLWIIKNEIID